MIKYYTIKFFVEYFDDKINQEYITENIADKICDVLGCDYHKMGFILLHPDHDCKDLGSLYLKKNKAKFYKRNIVSRMYGEKYKDEVSSPRLIYESYRSEFASYSNFTIDIDYPLKSTGCLEFEIVVKKSLLRKKKITLEEYIKILNILNDHNFKVNTSFIHLYRGSGSRVIAMGFATFLNTIEENYIRERAIAHMFDWKNKLVDVFMYNTFPKECLDDKQLAKLTKIVGKNNVKTYKDYVIFKSCRLSIIYLFQKYLPTIKKLRLRRFFKKNKMM